MQENVKIFVTQYCFSFPALTTVCFKQTKLGYLPHLVQRADANLPVCLQLVRGCPPEPPRWQWHGTADTNLDVVNKMGPRCSATCKCSLLFQVHHRSAVALLSPSVTAPLLLKLFVCELVKLNQMWQHRLQSQFFLLYRCSFQVEYNIHTGSLYATDGVYYSCPSLFSTAFWFQVNPKMLQMQVYLVT